MPLIVPLPVLPPFQMQGCQRIAPQNVRNVDGYKGDIFYEAVAVKHADLEFLDLTNMPKVTDKGLAALIKGCPRLSPCKLLSNCKGSMFFQAVVTSRPDLEVVDLRDCEGATDEGLAALVRNCPKLHPDKICSHAKGEAFLAAVVAHHQDIRQIDVQNCAVCEKSLARMLRKCPEM